MTKFKKDSIKFNILLETNLVNKNFSDSSNYVQNLLNLEEIKSFQIELHTDSYNIPFWKILLVNQLDYEKIISIICLDDTIVIREKEECANPKSIKQLINKTRCKSRYRYFELEFHIKHNRYESLVLGSDILKFMEKRNFFDQLYVENLLSNSEIEDRSRIIKFVEFNAYLKLSDSNIPCWQVQIKTSSLTTRKVIGLYLSRELYKDEYNSNKINWCLKIKPIDEFSQIKKDKQLSITNRKSRWFPGYFNDKTILLNELLKDEMVKCSIIDRPDKYAELIKVTEFL